MRPLRNARSCHSKSDLESPARTAMPQPDFNGVRVLSLESRRAQEMSKLIANNGGSPLVVPSVREVPLESNTEALDFAQKLSQGAFDIVIFTTGVGVRLLARIAQQKYSVEKFAELLRSVTVVARGPKPVAALREIGVPVTIAVPEPNTWRDLLTILDQRQSVAPLTGKRVALQEYGTRNDELIGALKQRGAQVTPVPVYEWTLPDDTGPLEQAVAVIAAGEVNVVLVTSSIQIRHLFQIAETTVGAKALRDALQHTVVASIGPLTSEAIREEGLAVDMEPTHPKMGFLVQEAAQRSGALLQQKRQAGSS